MADSSIVTDPELIKLLENSATDNDSEQQDLLEKAYQAQVNTQKIESNTLVQKNPDGTIKLTPEQKAHMLNIDKPIEPRPITNSPAFMAVGMGPVARASGLVSKLVGATAVGGTGGSVAPFVDKPPSEAIKEVPSSVLENAIGYGVGEGIAYPVSKLAANVLRGGKTALAGKSTTVPTEGIVKPITPAEAAVIQATTHVSKAELNAGFKSIPKSVQVIGDALDTVGKTNLPVRMAMKQAADKQIEANAKAVSKIAEAIVEPPDLSGSVVRDPATNNLQPMYHGTQSVFEEFDANKIGLYGLYGKGFYFTDNPVIAGGIGLDSVTEAATGKIYKAGDKLGYAGKIQDLVPYWQNKIKDFEARLAANPNDYSAKTMLEDAKKQLEYYSKNGNPNVHKVYLNVQNPFKIDEPIAPEKAKEIFDLAGQSPKKFENMPEMLLPGSQPNDEITGQVVYDFVESIYGKDSTTGILKKAGYDGIAHTGGAITGNDPHNVIIAFDKKQIIPAYDYDHKVIQWRKELLNIVTSEPAVVKGKIVNEQPFKFDSTSGIDNQEFAFGKFETIDPDMDEVTNGMAMIKQAIDDPNYKGLPDLVDDVQDLIAIRIEKETGHPARVVMPDGTTTQYAPSLQQSLVAQQNPGFTMGGTPSDVPVSNLSNIGGGYGPQPPISGALPPPPGIGGVPGPVIPQPNNTPIRFPIGISGVAPTNRVALIFEANNPGIPTATKLYYNGRKAAQESMEHVDQYSKIVEDIFGDLYGFTKKKRASQEKVTQALEITHAFDPTNNTFNIGHANGSFTSNLDLPAATRAINAEIQAIRPNSISLTPEEVLVAGKLRKFYDDAHQAGSVPYQQYQDFYSPRFNAFKKEEDRFNWVKNLRTDQLAFFQHARTGSLLPREENALKLADHYVRSWAHAKYIFPWDEQIARPILHEIGNRPGKLGSVALDYFKEYRDNIVGVPNKASVKFDAFVDTTIDNTIGWLSPDTADALRARFSADRTGELLSSKLTNAQMKGFLGFRPIPAMRNATQRLFALPLMPKDENFGLSKGLAKTLTVEGKAKIKAAEVLGPIGPFLHGDVAQSWYSPLKVYEAVEQNNRGAIYLTIHDAVNRLWDKGATIGEAADKLKLHLYAKPVQQEFRNMWNAGKVGDVRNIGQDNAAHWLGDWSTIMTQFPYERGANASWIRKNAITRQFGLFQSWSLYATDYLTNVTKDALIGPNKIRDTANIAKMLGYFTLMDMAFENVTGIPLLSSPITSIVPRGLTSPISTLGTSGLTYINTAISEIMNDLTSDRKNKYLSAAKKQAGKEFTRTLPGFVPGGKAAVDLFKSDKPKTTDISGD